MSSNKKASFLIDKATGSAHCWGVECLSIARILDSLNVASMEQGAPFQNQWLELGLLVSKKGFPQSVCFVVGFPL